MNGSLCAAVVDDPSAPRLLEEARRTNAFVFVDDGDGGWLRYHRMFAALLEAELMIESPELIPVLHRRAARWFVENGLFEEAIEHAIAAGDGGLASRYLYDGWRELALKGRWANLRTLLDRLPEEVGDLATFREALDILVESFEGVDPRITARRIETLDRGGAGEQAAELIDIMRVNPFHGDVGRALRDGQEAWSRYSQTPLRFTLAAQLGMVLWFAGYAARARELIEPLLSGIAFPASNSRALGTLAFVAADEGNAEVAELYARQALDAIDGPWAAGPEAHFALTALAEALRLQGALDEAAVYLQRARLLTGDQPHSLRHAFTLIFDAQLQFSKRELAAARARAAAARAIIEGCADFGAGPDRIEHLEPDAAAQDQADLLGSLPTPAEVRVLALLPSKLTFEQIAERLFISINTVATHRRRLYRRLGADSRQEAVAIARRRGLL